MAKTWVMSLAAVVLASSAALAQEEKKQQRGGANLGLPSAADLKEKAGLDDEQVKKVDEIYASYKDKIAEATKKMKEADDKKAAAGEMRTLRQEIAGKLVEIGSDDEQKKKITEATAPPQRKKKENTN